MSDRKPLDEVFDFPTGQPPSPGERRPRKRDPQQNLFGEHEQPRPRSGPAGASAPDTGGEAPRWQTEGGLFEEAPSPPHGATTSSRKPRAEPSLLPLDLEAPGHGTASSEDLPGVAPRSRAGLADLLIVGLALSLAVLAMLPLGLVPAIRLWPGFALFSLVFSLLYVTLPLAFWGQTPGMAWQGIKARDLDGLSLTYSQTVLRWLGSLLTLAGLGLPMVMALTGRSLGDRLSRSRTDWGDSVP